MEAETGVANSDLSEGELVVIYGDLVKFINFEAPTYGDLTSPEAIAASLSSTAAPLSLKSLSQGHGAVLGE